MTDLATPEDVAAFRAPFTEAELPQVASYLMLAQGMLRRRRPKIDDWIATGAVDAQLVRSVLGNVVRRALANPDGVQQQTAGSFSMSFDRQVAAGFVFISDAELDLLSPPRTTPRIGTINVAPVIWQ